MKQYSKHLVLRSTYNTPLTILGIDPGTASTGFGIIKKKKNQLELVDFGCINTRSHLPLISRLKTIDRELRKIFRKFRPKAVACEKLFFFKNLKTAISVSQASGVILLAIAKAKIPFYEYSPLQIKQTLVGYGRANKKQVQKMVKILLRLKNLPRPDDAADALACAICHVQMNRYKRHELLS